MTISLICAAIEFGPRAGAREYVLSLFVWGRLAAPAELGPALGLAWRFAIGLVAAVLLLRPLSVLTLDDSSARSLGMAVNGARLAIIALAVWLAASVVALVGVIGFVGLAAPAFARISGARTPRAQLLLAPLLGALLLWLTDGLVQVAGADALPTGAATGLIGGPLLLWLLPRLKHVQRPQAATPWPAPRLSPCGGSCCWQRGSLCSSSPPCWSAAPMGAGSSPRRAVRAPRPFPRAARGGRRSGGRAAGGGGAR